MLCGSKGLKFEVDSNISTEVLRVNGFSDGEGLNLYLSGLRRVFLVLNDDRGLMI